MHPRSLRLYNTGAGALHLTQGVVILMLSSGFLLLVAASFLEAPPGSAPPPLTELFTIDIGYAVTLFVFLSAAAHFIVSAPRIYEWYMRNLGENRNYARWIEYAISSSLMMVIIAMLPGISDIAALLGIFFVNAGMILFGLVMEHYEQPGNPDWLSYSFGVLLGIVPWVAVAIYLWSPTTDASPPAFVYGIFFSIFIFFNSFAINMILQYRRIGPWRNYLVGESTYMLLSLIAKSALAWQVFAGTLASERRLPLLHATISMSDIHRLVCFGISSCLTGQEVRYDGGHLKDSFLMGTLADHVQWVPVCPELEVGMGVPREEIRLIGSPDSPRLVGSRTEIDHTEPMQDWARERIPALAGQNLDGFVLTANSPSCGLLRVRVYQSKGAPAVKQGVGIFARALTDWIPDLPVEENGRLHDPRLRENFVERIFVRRRWHQMLEDDPTPGGLVRFHTAHKMIFMAHSNSHYRSIGRVVASAGITPWSELITRYQAQMTEALRLIATPKKNTNVLHHLMGFLKEAIPADDKQELLDIIDQYRSEQLPLIVPVTLQAPLAKPHCS